MFEVKFIILFTLYFQIGLWKSLWYIIRSHTSVKSTEPTQKIIQTSGEKFLHKSRKERHRIWVSIWFYLFSVFCSVKCVISIKCITDKCLKYIIIKLLIYDQSVYMHTLCVRVCFLMCCGLAAIII